MPNHPLSATPGRRAKTDPSITLGLSIVILFFIASGIIAYWNIRILSFDAQRVSHTHEVITALEASQSTIQDAETGQRGYLITGNEKYLEPYNSALALNDERFGVVERLMRDAPEQQTRLASIKAHMNAKLAELAQTVNLMRAHGFDAARAVVVTDRGKNEMDALRAQIGNMQREQEEMRAQRLAEMGAAYKIAVISSILTGALGIFLSGAVAYLVRRNLIIRKRQEWLQTGQVKLAEAMFGEQRLEKLGESILKFLAEYCDAHAGAMYSKEGSHFHLVSIYGAARDKVPAEFDLSGGLLAQAVKDNRILHIRDVPDGYLAIGSALGEGNPRHLIIIPAITDGVANAVLELGFIHPLDGLALELLEKIADSIGIAVKSANYRANLQNFLEETQRQSEELQAQGEELRVSNEELEEQSRALRESQSRLEQQQAELEQTNAQLEEQAQVLEGQRDSIARANAAVQLKAQELERASQYKSDFLANMSHELRTPLNSSLILAKLLADNAEGNLTQEQIKFAKTIQSSGNDLLSLINDILDLSKIEAGHMEIQPEQVFLDRLAHDLTHVFDPLAREKGLALQMHIHPECPQSLETDRQRLEQILKNLLSNAIKFTERGGVELSIRCGANKQISFTVRDTGIGIALEQQQAIFDAFRQADGTISRKYGGTGLGLSISRELVRLLGGTIELSSEPGQGSAFCVTLPDRFHPQPAQRVEAAFPSASAPTVRAFEAPAFAPPPASAQPAVAARRHSIQDDRERLHHKKRVILVVEDDENFARILYDMAQELEFQCLVATTAEEALAVAMHYKPSAVVLDVGLPDGSGLAVLDRLKHDARTRHIPVHVVSGGDHAQMAMSIGAVGYMLKPVKREELLDTLRKLEAKLSRQMKRVLVVEDDDVQRSSVCRLLSSHDVETVGAGTASECLDLLKQSTFDCMVLDLSLPDASGYHLLETLSKEDAYSFPPVIVYTGRDLSADEEQKLRKFSKSIIIKGAKSPERLLDEVTLFLHQVVSELPAEQQRMLEKARNRDAVLEDRRILVVEDDVRNVYALTSIMESRGARVEIARNGREGLEMLEKAGSGSAQPIDLVLMDVMMPEMDGLTATREIRKRAEWKKLPIIMLTAKAMRDDQERCLEAGASDYMAKPLDVEKLLSLVRVWMPR